MPVAQRLGVVEAQQLDVHHVKAGVLDDRGQLGQGRQVAAGEDVLADEGIDRSRLVVAPDGVQQEHAVLIQKVVGFPEELLVVPLAHMLEHADRNDAVEGVVHLAIVAQLEADLVPQPFLFDPLGGEAVLFGGERDAGQIAAGLTRQRQTQTAPAGADVQDLQARLLDVELGGDVALFLRLGALQIVAGVHEVGAGVLAVAVQEEVVELAREIVVMRDVLARLADGVVLLKVPALAQHLVRGLGDRMALQVRVVLHGQFHEVAQVSVLHAPIAVHVAFGDGEHGVGEQLVGAGRPFHRKGALGLAASTIFSAPTRTVASISLRNSMATPRPHCCRRTRIGAGSARFYSN